MRKVEARIKTPFGEVVVEGETAQEVLSLLESFPENFIESVGNFVSSRLVPSSAQLKGIVESTTEGPVIVAREDLTHYEAVGLTLYASDGRKSTAAQIQKLLDSSGIKCMVPARLNEMTKRGQVFKPDPNRPEFKLTMQGERWIEDDVLGKIRGKMG
jgi:predicted class III extradiol MEMO1 family dioxygenase